jgi:tetratricopeptide (TPR) repeat protein
MSRGSLTLLALCALLAAAGCSELRGRKKIQEGNAAFKSGDFAAAVARFEEARVFVPQMPLLWLNRGYACRELIVPGAPPTVNRTAGACALDSFKRLRELAPDDPRGDRLYVQTLLDLGEYPTIERTFLLRHERTPGDLDVILVLQKVYTKLGRWRDALAFYRKGAALRPADAEAQYAVGTFIWQVLQSHGGGPAFAQYDPRPRPPDQATPSGSAAAASGVASPPRPVPGADDIVGGERVALAEEGVRYLGRAVALRPHYTDALTYMALLYRQESFALFDDPAAWERVVDQAVASAGRAAHRN